MSNYHFMATTYTHIYTHAITLWPLHTHTYTHIQSLYGHYTHIHTITLRTPHTYTHQFSSAAQLCPTLCDPMNHSTPGLPVHHQLPEFIQTHVHRVHDAIQPSHPLSSPSPAHNPSQHQSLFQWVAKVLEFQLQLNFSPSNEHLGLISFRMD